MSGRQLRSNSVNDVSTKQTKSATGPQETKFSLEDVRSLLQQSEARIISKLEDVLSRIERLEKRIDSVQTEQIRLDLEMTGIKKVVINQQHVIEQFEAEKRETNLIFSGVPEGDIEIDDDCLDDDKEKIEYLCNVISPDFLERSIESCSRLGKATKGRNRLITVKFNDMSERNSVLFSKRKIRNNSSCLKYFGPVYINKDSSPLMRKEEKRLRDFMKNKRKNSPSDAKFYIKSGKLYCDDKVIDQIDISKQLF